MKYFFWQNIEEQTTRQPKFTTRLNGHTLTIRQQMQKLDCPLHQTHDLDRGVKAQRRQLFAE